jgi:general secretion pathway protein A
VLGGAAILRPNSIQYVSDWWAKRIMPPAVAMPPSSAALAPSAPSIAPVAVPAATAPAVKPALGPLLDARTRDRDAAFTKLFAVWGEDYATRRGEAGCDFARRAGLRCLMKTGTWKVLRRLDLPATLTLATPNGDRHYATMTALHEDAATLDVAGESVTLPLTEIEQFWDGAFVALWRAPGLTSSDLRPGMSSRDVAWLRQQLPNGGSSERTTVYDDELKERVVAFQRANGLTPDGIVGDETLVRLTAMSTDARMPSLSKARP